MDELPVTINGKINRKALPSHEFKANKEYIAPANETEDKLADIWSQVLSIAKEEISVNANFFYIGGHSLKATVLIGKIHKELGVEFPLRDVFLNSTIKDQANKISLSIKKDFIAIPKAIKKDFYSLSSAQKRLYFLQQMDLESITYNIPGEIILPENINRTSVQKY
jgi:acyl carrier protein